MSAPYTFPKTHDLREGYSSHAFFRTMSSDEMCEFIGLFLYRAFQKLYNSCLQEVGSSLIAFSIPVHRNGQ